MSLKLYVWLWAGLLFSCDIHVPIMFVIYVVLCEWQMISWEASLVLICFKTEIGFYSHSGNHWPDIAQMFGILQLYLYSFLGSGIWGICWAVVAQDCSCWGCFWVAGTSSFVLVTWLYFVHQLIDWNRSK